jgi:ligand-binding SRPBCC domain-containing protein
MPVFNVTTEINAPIERCFDLSRSIDLHVASIPGSKEVAIAGVTSGLIGLGEEVTWEATHFGIRQRLSSVITACEVPHFFRDEMTKGIFKMIRHDHRFTETNGITLMRDRFEFESPFSFIGDIANTLVINWYLKKLIMKRNQVIKTYAESTQWKQILQ